AGRRRSRRRGSPPGAGTCSPAAGRAAGRGRGPVGVSVELERVSLADGGVAERGTADRAHGSGPLRGTRRYAVRAPGHGSAPLDRPAAGPVWIALRRHECRATTAAEGAAVDVMDVSRVRRCAGLPDRPGPKGSSRGPGADA